MILLIDNKSNMIRFCENDPDIYGLDVCYPNWRGYTKFLSDTGHTVVLSGPEAEEWLDHESIYYVHVEDKANETYTQFKRRIDKLIEENKEFIKSNTSFGKLVFSLDQNLNASDRWADNVVEVWRCNEDGKYRMFLNLPEGRCNHCYANILSEIISEYDRLVGILEDEEKVDADELTDEDFHLTVSDTLTGLSVRLHMLQHLYEENLIKNDNVCEELDEEEEDEYDDECDDDCDEDEGCDEEEEEALFDLAQKPETHELERIKISDGDEDTIFVREDDTYTINGEDVSKEEWEERLKKACKDDEEESEEKAIEESEEENVEEEDSDDEYEDEDSTEDEVWDEDAENEALIKELASTQEGRDALAAALLEVVGNEILKHVLW